MHWKRALGLGFLSWLAPFAISFAAFPVKRSSPALFDTLMALVLVACSALLAARYFRTVPLTVRAATAVGILWMAMNLLLDWPMFSHGPMQMRPFEYMADIGAAYLIYPSFMVSAAILARRQA